MKTLKNKKGFTILETLIALAVFALVSLSAINILSFAYTSNSRIIINNELFEHGKMTIDFIAAHVNRACEINLITDEIGTLKELQLAHMERQGTSENYTKVWQSIVYNSTSHQVRFGQTSRNNEISSYIADIKIKIDGEVMEIELATDDRLKSNDKYIVFPINLKTKISLKYKDTSIEIKKLQSNV